MIDFIMTFGILILIVTAVSFAAKIFKQPIILGYVVAGIAVSHFFISQSGLDAELAIFSEIGITFLLFLMGLEFDLKGLKYFGKDVFIASLIQSVIFFSVAFGIALGFGFEIIQSVYLGILFMFSSTLLAAKWVDDKKEGNTLHGKITLSILIIQDLFAIIILTVLSILKESSLTMILLVPAEGLLLLGLAFVMAKYILNIPLKLASRYPELLFLVSLSVCFAFVVIAPMLGYSTTIGAFLGGIILANTLFKAEVTTRLKPLIIFFNMLFFVGLGFQMEFSMSPLVFAFIIVLCLVSLVLKPLVVYITLRVRGYDMKTSFLSGIYLSQLSEFGIIIIAGSVASGVLTDMMSSIAIISVIATMILSSYLIKYDKTLFKMFEVWIAAFDKRFVVKGVEMADERYTANILFFGYRDINKELLTKFKTSGKKIMVIEHNPEHIALMKREKIPCIYNSVNNPDFFEHLSFEKVEMIISNLSDIDENEMLIKEMKKTNPKALVITTAKHLKESLELYKLGADYVIYSPSLSDEKVSIILDDYTTDINRVLEKKISELTKLKDMEARLDQSNKEGFYDIDSVIKVMKPRRRGTKEINDEAGDREEVPEYRMWGDRYL